MAGSDLVTVWLGFDGYDYPSRRTTAKISDLASEAFDELARYRLMSAEHRVQALRGAGPLRRSPARDSPVTSFSRWKANVGATLDFCAHADGRRCARVRRASLFVEDKLGAFISTTATMPMTTV